VVKAAPETAAKDLAWVAGIPQKDLRDLILQDLKNYQPAQAEDAVTIPQDEFYEACARALGRLFLDPYIERSRNGRSASFTDVEVAIAAFSGESLKKNDIPGMDHRLCFRSSEKALSFRSSEKACLWSFLFVFS
jgi:hypothetical protein